MKYNSIELFIAKWAVFFSVTYAKFTRLLLSIWLFVFCMVLAVFSLGMIRVDKVLLEYGDYLKEKRDST